MSNHIVSRVKVIECCDLGTGSKWGHSSIEFGLGRRIVSRECRGSFPCLSKTGNIGLEVINPRDSHTLDRPNIHLFGGRVKVVE